MTDTMTPDDRRLALDAYYTDPSTAEVRRVAFLEASGLLEKFHFGQIPSMRDTVRLGLLIQAVRRTAAAEEREAIAKVFDRHAEEVREYISTMTDFGMVSLEKQAELEFTERAAATVRLPGGGAKD